MSKLLTWLEGLKTQKCLSPLDCNALLKICIAFASKHQEKEDELHRVLQQLGLDG